MKIWVLRKIEIDDASMSFSPEVESRGFVVRARSERQARMLACQEDERAAQWWEDAELSTCCQIEQRGGPSVIMGDWPVV